MAVKLIPVAAFLIPVIACWITGSNLGVARILIGAGIVLYLLGSLLKNGFARKGAPAPAWVSLMGLVGTGLAPAGIAVLLFLSLGLIQRV